MKFTYDDVLEELNLNRYDEITLDELDERIIKVIDEDVTTQLNDGYGATEVLKDGKYHYWYNADDENGNNVYFEVVQINESDKVYSIIRII